MSGESPPVDRLKDRYRLLEVVGEGGMAVVWRAEDELLGRTVAVKILRPQYANDPDFLARLRSEARSAAALSDPGVVGVYDVGEDGGRHFLVLEYVAGRDLKAIIRAEGALAPERAVSIASAVARALAKAHVLGMVHRDIKPQNVLVAQDGRVKVTDFGIARAVSAVGMTAPGIVLGTVHYLAPELAAGGAASPASDVFSLGVVLYEMLTGRLPYDADSSVGVAVKIMNEAPEPIERANARVPSGLAAIVRRAMARSVADRYPDAGALADDLDAFSRWSEQATAAVPRPVSTDAGDATNVAVPGHRVAPRVPPVVPHGAAADGPTLDPVGLLLGLIAIVALAGLIPLWGAVRERVATPVLPARLAPMGNLFGGPTAVLTPVPTATVPSVTVPNVVGLPRRDAEIALQNEGLGVTVNVEPASDVAPGRVMRQLPEPGTAVLSEAVIELVVSGEAPVAVPEAAGDWSSVSAAIEARGLVPVQRSQWGVPYGQVVGIDPPSGSRLPRGAPVHVTVGSGSWLPLGVDFADNIHLSGVDVNTAQVRPGETMSLAATWEATNTTLASETAPAARGEYLVRAQLVGPDGQVAAVDAHVPGGGARPTSAWQPGEVIRGDLFNLVVDPAAAPGTYTLWIDVQPSGDPASSLAILDSAFARRSGDRVQVLNVEVVGPEATEG